MTCSCSHHAITHRYVTTTRSNVGECLARECWCRGFVDAESAQNPHFVRDSGVATWENRNVQREPDRANESDSLATVSTRPKGA